MLDEILEESWTYQEIFQKGYLKGLELARQSGDQYWVDEERETTIKLLQLCFPGIVSLAQPRIESINDRIALHALLNRLFEIISMASDEAKQAIIDASTAETHE